MLTSHPLLYHCTIAYKPLLYCSPANQAIWKLYQCSHDTKLLQPMRLDVQCTLYFVHVQMHTTVPLQCTDIRLISRSDTSTNVHCVTAQCIAPSWTDFTESNPHCTKLLESIGYNPNDWVLYNLNLIITLPWRIRSKCRLYCVHTIAVWCLQSEVTP